MKQNRLIGLRLPVDKLTPARTRVLETVRELIVSGELRPGDRLAERNLAAELQVSTTPVKEALRHLEYEGLVKSVPRRGTYVAALPMASLDESSQIRAALEGVAARLAAAKATPEELMRMHEQLEDMARLTTLAEHKALVDANSQFHNLLLKSAGNPWVAQLVGVLTSFERAIRHRALTQTHEAERGLQEHTAIYAAVARHDPDVAEALVKSHILRTARFVLQQETSEC